jgi:hypothetical protein
MQIANRHSRLTFLSLLSGKSGDREMIVKNGMELMKYRIENKDNIDINWNNLFQHQHYQLNDQIGTRYLGFLPEDLIRKD